MTKELDNTRSNQRQFYKQVDQLDKSEWPMPNEEETGEKLCK